MSNHIGLLNEQPLHAALKEWYARPKDRLEVSVAGFVIDVVRGDLLVEIQTGNFASVKSKLMELTNTHAMRLVYPIAHRRSGSSSWPRMEAAQRPGANHPSGAR